MTRNIFLFTFDALGAKFLQERSDRPPVAPTISNLADAGTRFRNAFTPSSHTREAVPAMLSGEYPDRCIDERYRLTAETVASSLPERYSVGGFHSNPYVSRAYGYGDDFDEYDDDLYLGGSRLFALGQRLIDKLRNRHYASAESLSRRIADWVQQTSTPVFVWGHYMDPHGPYHPPEQYQREFHGETVGSRRAQRLYSRAVEQGTLSKPERREMLDMYAGEIRYADEQLRQLLARLDEAGSLDDAVVLIAADHGDAFGENGYYGHPRRLDDELLHVPMVARGDSFDDRNPVSVPVSLLDIVPTVLSLVGADPPDDSPGTPLTDIVSTPEAYTDRQVFAQVRGRKTDSGIRRYAIRTREGGTTLDRDIASGEILTDDPTGDGRLSRDLRRHIASRDRAVEDRQTETTAEANAVVADRLAALGYDEE